LEKEEEEEEESPVRQPARFLGTKLLKSQPDVFPL
jgi:hypothetical protein